MKNTGVKYGVYALVITIVWTLIEHLLGYNTTKHEIGEYTRMVGGFVFWVAVILSIVATKGQLGGYMTLGQGMKTGSIVSLIYGLGVTAWYCIYGEVINTQYKPTLIAFEQARLAKENATAEVVAAKIKQVEMMTGGSVMSYLWLFGFMLVIGIVLSLITSLIVKKARKG